MIHVPNLDSYEVYVQVLAVCSFSVDFGLFGEVVVLVQINTLASGSRCHLSTPNFLTFMLCDKQVQGDNHWSLVFGPDQLSFDR